MKYDGTANDHGKQEPADHQRVEDVPADLQDRADIVVRDDEGVFGYAQYEPSEFILRQVKKGDRERVGNDRGTQDGRSDVLPEEKADDHDRRPCGTGWWAITPMNTPRAMERAISSGLPFRLRNRL